MSSRPPLLAHWPAPPWRRPRRSGLWKTIDDETKAEKSLVRITESGGVLTGKVEKMLDPSQAGRQVRQVHRRAQGPAGAGHDHRARRASTAPTTTSAWDGGDILDPNNGKVYKVRMKPVDGGKKLEVRGYIGCRCSAAPRPGCASNDRQSTPGEPTVNRFQVRKVAVLGAGVMGAQIAAHLVNCKVPVVLFDLPAKDGPKNGIVATRRRRPEEAQARAAGHAPTTPR